MKKSHPGVVTILWDPRSAYYTWPILASGGGFVFGANGSDYDLRNVGVATPGAVIALSEIVALMRAGILPKVCPYSETEELMGQGKLAMMISGPWAWSNLIKKGIDFGVGQIPGVDGKVGRPFVGVSMAYLNRSSPNQDLAKEFIERYLLTDTGLTAMDNAKPIGVPALISFYDKLATDNPASSPTESLRRYRPDHAKCSSNGPVLHLDGCGPAISRRRQTLRRRRPAASRS